MKPQIYPADCAECGQNIHIPTTQGQEIELAIGIEVTVSLVCEHCNKSLTVKMTRDPGNTRWEYL